MKTLKTSVLLSFIALTGCSYQMQEDYVKSPSVKNHLLKQIPGVENHDIEVISICYGNNPDLWMTSVEFGDGQVFNYTMNMLDGKVAYDSSSTKAQRSFNRSQSNRSGNDYGCIGTPVTAGLGGYFHVSGSYRLHVGWLSTEAYVYKGLVINKNFGEDDIERLNKAVIAIKAAIEKHRKTEPTEKSWGV